MVLSGAHAPGATPLTEEDLRGLRIATIRTQRDLNEAEAATIIRGQGWARRARMVQLPQLLTDRFVQRLHKALFGDVWHWAGTYRTSDTNIGVHAYIDALRAADAHDFTPLLRVAQQ